MNNKGKGSGLALILILIVTLIVAFLFMKQSGSLGIGRSPEQNQDPVQQAQDVVNQIYEQQEKAMEALEGFKGRKNTVAGLCQTGAGLVDQILTSEECINL